MWREPEPERIAGWRWCSAGVVAVAAPFVAGAGVQEVLAEPWQGAKRWFCVVAVVATVVLTAWLVVSDLLSRPDPPWRGGS